MRRLPVDADDPRANAFGDLRYGAADPAARANDQQSLARRELGGVDGAAPGGHEIDADRGGLSKTQSVRLSPQARYGDGDALGMRAVAREADIAASAPHLRADPLARALLDDACIVAAGNTRQRGLAHRAGHVFHVARVDRRRFDAHDGCNRIGDGIRNVDEIKRLDVPERFYLQSAHDLFLRILVFPLVDISRCGGSRNEYK